MKVGMNLLLWTAAPQEEHIPLIRQIAEWGFDGVELPMFAPDASPWKKLAPVMDDLGLGRTAVVIMPEGGSLCSDDKAAHQLGVDHLKASVDACGEAGITTIAGPIFHPVGDLVGRGPEPDELKRVADGLRAAGEYAAKSDIALSVEPLNRFETYVINAQADARELVDAVGLDNVGILYDSFHANIEEKDLSEAIRAGGSKINHVHISSNDRSTPGEDHIDWGTTFAALKEIGYDSWLTIEAFGAWLPEIAGATCIWRKMAPSEEHIAREGLKFVHANRA